MHNIWVHGDPSIRTHRTRRDVGYPSATFTEIDLHLTCCISEGGSVELRVGDSDEWDLKSPNFEDENA